MNFPLAWSHLLLPSWYPTPHNPTLEVDTTRQIVTLKADGIALHAYTAKIAQTTSPNIIDNLDRLGLSPEALQELKGFKNLKIEHLASPRKKRDDLDQDGIPNNLDAALGARKAALNAADYTEGYEKLTFPGGDVDRTRGVCTDVVVRSWRNAGLDLQEKIYRDMKKRRKSYGLGAKKNPDRNIEHRRVRRQIVYFKKYYRKLPTTFEKKTRGTDAWLPGDIVFMDTFPKRTGPDHVGIVSDKTDSEGRPMIINNWTHGFSTGDMALLDQVPITHRFRIGETHGRPGRSKNDEH